MIDEKGQQVGIVSTQEAMRMAENAELDLVEVVPTSSPPVCKILDYGKYRYDQTKREKENKKAQHQVKVKEVKLKPNINDHDLFTKIRRARDFLSKGNKVKVTCMFRGREMAHPQIGENLVKRVADELSDVSTLETPLRRMGRFIHIVLAPGVKKKKSIQPQVVQSEEKQKESK